MTPPAAAPAAAPETPTTTDVSLVRNNVGNQAQQQSSTHRVPNQSTRFSLLWDVFMICVALTNINLILFDISYLPIMRPFYVRYFPEPVSKVYDKYVKGIEPEPLTAALLWEVDTTQLLLRLDAASFSKRSLSAHLNKLRDLTRRVLVQDNPFTTSTFCSAGRQNNCNRTLELLQEMIAEETGDSVCYCSSSNSSGYCNNATTRSPMAQLLLTQKSVNDFWTSKNATKLARRLDLFQDRLYWQFKVNFNTLYRKDRYWMLDMPFLILYWFIFLASWIHAWRTSQEEYSLYTFLIRDNNWYNLLALFPNVNVFFQLLRIGPLYVTMWGSQFSIVQTDVDEVADTVYLQVVERFKEEIRNGTYLGLLERSLDPRRSAIKHLIANQIRDSLTDPATVENFRELLLLNLNTAVDKSETLDHVPLPTPLVRSVVRSVGGVVLETTVDALTMTMASERGQQSVEQLVSRMVDQAVDGPEMQQLKALATDMSLDVLDQLEERVVVREQTEASTKNHHRGERAAAISSRDNNDGHSTASPFPRFVVPIHNDDPTPSPI